MTVAPWPVTVHLRSWRANARSAGSSFWGTSKAECSFLAESCCFLLWEPGSLIGVSMLFHTAQPGASWKEIYLKRGINDFLSLPAGRQTHRTLMLQVHQEPLSQKIYLSCSPRLWEKQHLYQKVNLLNSQDHIILSFLAGILFNPFWLQHRKNTWMSRHKSRCKMSRWIPRQTLHYMYLVLS